VRYVLDSVDPATAPSEGPGVAVTERFGPARGCELFTQRLLVVADAGSGPQLSPESDEVLFVFSGGGVLSAGGENTGIWAGAGAFVRAGVPWQLEAVDELQLLSVQVHRPEEVGRQPLAVVDLAGTERLSATAARQFVLGITPAVGCVSATQFLGFVPPGRAPDHFHRYDEVIYVLDGEGLLHIGGETGPLGPGSCVHLPARLVHCLENTGDRELQLLGVFRPAGSPAEAYYPDGTPAAYPEES